MNNKIIANYRDLKSCLFKQDWFRYYNSYMPIAINGKIVFIPFTARNLVYCN